MVFSQFFILIILFRTLCNADIYPPCDNVISEGASGSFWGLNGFYTYDGLVAGTDDFRQFINDDDTRYYIAGLDDEESGSRIWGFFGPAEEYGGDINEEILCSRHSDCDGYTYCDVYSSCWTCEDCDRFDDAIDGRCPYWCSSEEDEYDGYYSKNNNNANECTNYSGWVDVDGDTCFHYEDNDWCGIAEEYESGGISATDACCYCGGGTHPGDDVTVMFAFGMDYEMWPTEIDSWKMIEDQTTYDGYFDNDFGVSCVSPEVTSPPTASNLDYNEDVTLTDPITEIAIWMVVVAIIVPILCCLLLIGLCCWCYRRQKEDDTVVHVEAGAASSQQQQQQQERQRVTIQSPQKYETVPVQIQNYNNPSTDAAVVPQVVIPQHQQYEQQQYQQAQIQQQYEAARMAQLQRQQLDVQQQQQQQAQAQKQAQFDDDIEIGPPPNYSPASQRKSGGDGSGAYTFMPSNAAAVEQPTAPPV